MKNAQPAIAVHAGALGISLGKFDALRLGAAKVGVRNEEFSASLAILARRLGEAHDEEIKLGGIAGWRHLARRPRRRSCRLPVFL